MRIVLIVVGFFALVLGVVGIFVPLLPTTPFILVSAWCFMKSSERFHKWLMGHPRLGPMVNNWREKGSIPRAAKSMALAMISVSFISIWLMVKILMIKVAVSLMLVGVVIFILSRPTG